MLVRLRQSKPGGGNPAFTLMEVLVTLFILLLVVSGVIIGYVQANRMAEWSAMSLATESLASQGAEQARAAVWSPSQAGTNTGPGTLDELPPSADGSAAITNVDYMDIPSKGAPGSADFNFWVTNYVFITQLTVNPPVRQIVSQAVWMFPVTGELHTNWVVMLHAPDQ